ncbi:MAG: excinuclease ABC subunit C, partial [bacterium]|nr:excinuclease ABC subunit C [bacterium]
SKSKILNIKIISLAKKNNELFLEGRHKPLLLKDLPPEVSNLILRIRDEAHRFAITYHKKLRSKNLLQK